MAAASALFVNYKLAGSQTCRPLEERQLYVSSSVHGRKSLHGQNDSAGCCFDRVGIMEDQNCHSGCDLNLSVALLT